MLVLLGGIGVDGAHVGDAATQLERVLLGGSAIFELGKRKRRLKRHPHVLDDGVDGSIDAHLQPALLHTGRRQARVHVIVSVVGGLCLLARTGDLRMQARRRILRLLGPLLKVVRPATGACGELLEHRQKRRDAALRHDLARQLVFQLVLGGVHRGHVAAASVHDARGISVALAQRGSRELRLRQAVTQLRRLLAKRHHLGFKLLSAHGTGLGRLRKLGQLRLKLVDVRARLGDRLIRLLALALDVGELAARGRERIGGALGLGRRRLRGPTALGQLLGKLKAFCLGGAQRLLGIALRPLGFLVLLGCDAKRCAQLVELSRTGQGALGAGVHRSHRELTAGPGDAPIGRHEAHRGSRAILHARRLSMTRRLEGFAHHHVAEQGLHRGRCLLGVFQHVHKRRAAESLRGLARVGAGTHTASGKQRHLAVTTAFQHAARKARRSIDRRGHKRLGIAGEQMLHKRLEALRRAHDAGQGLELLTGYARMLDEPCAGRPSCGRCALNLLERGNAAFERGDLAMSLVKRGTGGIAVLDGRGDGAARLRFGLLGIIERTLGGRTGILELLSLLLSVAERQLELLGAPFHQLGMGQAVGKRLLRLRQAAPRVLGSAIVGAALALELIELVLHAAAGLGVLATGVVKALDGGLRGGKVAAHRLKLGCRLLALGNGLGALSAARLQLHAHIGLKALRPTALLVQQQHGAVEALHCRRRTLIAARQVACILSLLADLLLQRLGGGFRSGNVLMTGLKVFHQLMLAGASLIPALTQATQVVHGQGQADVGKLPGELLVSAGLLRLALERSELAAHLARHIAHARERGIHGGQLALAFRLALLVLEHAGGLLDERAAVLGLGLQDGVQAALADD